MALGHVIPGGGDMSPRTRPAALLFAMDTEARRTESRHGNVQVLTCGCIYLVYADMCVCVCVWTGMQALAWDAY